MKLFFLALFGGWSPFKILGSLGEMPMVSQTQYLFSVKGVEKTEKEPVGDEEEGRREKRAIASPNNLLLETHCFLGCWISTAKYISI